MSLSVNVRCQNKIHTIVVNKNGKLHLCNHKITHAAIDEMNALISLGSQPCRCYDILSLWRMHTIPDASAGALPPELLKLYMAIRNSPEKRIVQRRARKLAKIYKRPFLSNATQKIDWKTVEAQNDTEKIRLAAITAIIAELTARGHKVKANLGERFVTYSTVHTQRYFDADIYTIDDMALPVTAETHMNGLRIRVDYDYSGFHYSHGIKDRLNVMFICDMIELAHNRRNVTAASCIPCNINKEVEFIELVSEKYKKVYAKLSFKNGLERTLEVRLPTITTDKSSVVIMLSELNALLNKYRAAGRIQKIKGT